MRRVSPDTLHRGSFAHAWTDFDSPNAVTSFVAVGLARSPLRITSLREAQTQFEGR
ncbi:MAG: hypothetical protein HZA53_16100 [Planctomycetes bacterium]|nr:hypothetical protein [Planctomycetota bacterium]